MIDKIFFKIQNQKAKLFTFFIKSLFKSFGPDSYIFTYPLTLRGLGQISIGSRTSIGKGVQLTAWEKGTISIGDNCIIRAYSHITSVNSISIGDNLLTGTNVLITDNSHGGVILR